eukprot:106949-Rhodomonas_salina.2
MKKRIALLKGKRAMFASVWGDDIPPTRAERAAALLLRFCTEISASFSPTNNLGTEIDSLLEHELQICFFLAALVFPAQQASVHSSSPEKDFKLLPACSVRAPDAWKTL